MTRRFPILGSILCLHTGASCIEATPRVAADPDTSGTSGEELDIATAPGEIDGDDPTESCDASGVTRCRDDGKALELCRDGFWQTTL